MHASTSSVRLMRNFMHTSSYRSCVRLQPGITATVRSAPLAARTAPPTLASTLAHLQPRRLFSSSRISRAALASHPPAQPTELLYSPTEEALRETEDADEDAPEVDLLPPDEATLEMTERAAEVRRAGLVLCWFA